MQRRQGSVDLGAYVRAIGLYARNPWLALAPLLTSLIGALLLMLVPPSNGPAGALSGGLMSLFVMLLDSFGLSVSLIVAEKAWRTGHSPFDEAWTDAKRKAPDILMATIGFNFLIYVAGLVGGFLGPIGGLVATAAAGFFFIYTIAAAAIGGIPGGAALQASIERVQRSYPIALVLGAVIILLVWLFAVVVNLVGPLVVSIPIPAPNAMLQVAEALIKAVGLGYIALVMAKAYDDSSMSLWRRY
jgi:hypothetical protein